jgi:hypothetical protein
MKENKCERNCGKELIANGKELDVGIVICSI